MSTPIEITVYDIQGISIIAEHNEPVVVRTTVAYKVNTSQAGQGQLKAELISPLQTSMNSCQCHIHEINNQEYLIQYIPNEPGRYQLRLLFNNQLVQEKTIDTNVYSLLPSLPLLSSLSLVHIEKILPYNIPRIGDDVCLEIITKKSSIHAKVSCNGIFIPCQIEQTKDTHIWRLKFRPYLIGTHKIYLFHNGLSIINSPYLIQVKDINGKNLLSGITNRPCGIEIHTKSISNSQIRAVVLLDTIQIPSTITIINDNLIRINFIPQEPGLYFINIYNGDQTIKGSPFSVHVHGQQVVQITGKCFHRLRVNNLGIFRIHCNEQRESIEAKIFNLSVGNNFDIGQKISFQLLETYEQLLKFPLEIFTTSLTILLTAQLRLTKERIRDLIFENKNGYAIISFQLFEIETQLPTNEQVINILRNLIDKQTIYLIDPNRRILHTICGSLIIGPKGESVNVKLFPQANGDYMGEFTPKKIGQHRIDITFGNMPIEGSPFFTEVYDPSQVHIGPLPKDILIGIENTLEINIDNAGNVPLVVSIISPSGINVPIKIDDILTIKKIIRFTPTEIGLHYLNAKFGSDIVSGTPIQMMVNNTRIVTAYGDGIHYALHEKETTFMIDTKDMQGDLQVHIEGSNSVIKTTIDRITNNLLKVTYIPVEVGFINISIKWNDKDIMNSPFKANVTNPGILKANIRGVDNTFIPLRIDQQDSLAILSFTILRDGKYDLTITYANNSLLNMPIRIISTSISLDFVKVKVHGRGSYEARINEETEFIIDTSQASNSNINKPIVRLIGTQTDVEVRIHQNEKNKNIFHCSYKPIIPGDYLLSIIWAEKEIHGSPFRVNILPNINNNHHESSRIICSGDGLRIGIVGKVMKCLIDTRATIPGELTAYCQGMNKKASCRLFDHRDGTYTLFIKPEEIGRHILTIKYNGENVPGSPYIVKVNNSTDIHKVHVSGPGIENGILSTFQSYFLCETKGAGAGQLTVKIRGPKGALRVEMQREHLQDRTILCRYNPIESGHYIISVKWSGEHVYGSPFHTHIFEYQEQLDQFRHQLNTYHLFEQKQNKEL
ncbi:unnamed protein product [Rotaria sp. Silwood1]|nr:unnamed protein product [Rotaria sp. Silwood1]